jgi:hypothetical protein
MERKDIQKEESKEKKRIVYITIIAVYVVGRGKTELIQLCCQLFMLIARVK